MASIYNLRGIVGKDLTDKEIKNFAKCVVEYIYLNKLNPSIIIAKDNRLSGDYILSVINQVLLLKGIEVNLIGVATTPQLCYLTKKFKFGLGIMITASHNTKEYNGFKCFDSCGESVDIYKQKVKTYKTKKYTKIKDASRFKELYLHDLKSRLNSNKIKCVFDCANGAMVEVVRKLFPRNQIIGHDCSGEYINDNYGSQHLENIKLICKRSKKIGFAFDGDGDRVVAIDENGEEVNGDKIIYILATQKLGFGDMVVGNRLSSLGLEISLRRLGVSLIRERVGAKYVARRMKKEGISLGGENCGHIFMDGVLSDGIAVAIELINILNRTGLKFCEILSGYKNMHQLSKDIAMIDVSNFVEFEKIDKGARIVVRNSGTENVVRVFVEGEDKGVVEDKLKETINLLTAR